MCKFIWNNDSSLENKSVQAKSATNYICSVEGLVLCFTHLWGSFGDFGLLGVSVYFQTECH